MDSGVTESAGSADAVPRFWGFVKRPACRAALAIVTLVSFVPRVYVFSRNHDVPSDTSGYLGLVALLHGIKPADGVVSYRIENPLYAFLIAAVEPFTDDWLVAARLVALIVSGLAPPLFCLCAWSLYANVWAGLAAGLASAFSWQLVFVSTTPLADGPFVSFSALAALGGLAFLRAQTRTRAALAGLSAGLAWSVKGPGAFYALVIGLLVLGTVLAAKRSWPALRDTARAWLPALAIFGACTLVAGKGPSLILKPFTTGLAMPLSYAKVAMLDGALYAKGGAVRDREIYRLNRDATAFDWMSRFDVSWREIVTRHGAAQLITFRRNLFQTFATTLPLVLAPLLMLFLPLGLGLRFVFSRRPILETLWLAGIALPYVLLIPAIQLHDRYLLPITVVAFPLVGIGLSRMLTGAGRLGRAKTALARIAAIALFVGIAVHGLTELRMVVREPLGAWTASYRDACRWLRERHGDRVSFAAMSRYHGVYAHLGGWPKTSLPIDSLERIARYCRHTRTRYIVYGDVERYHNIELSRALIGKGFRVEGMRFQALRTFGDVTLIEVTEDSSQNH